MFLSKYFFEGKHLSLIPRQKTDKGDPSNNDLFIKIGSEKEYPIYDLGDGIQTIIIFTFPLFKYRHKNHILFIDEPEQNLHPGMQRVLMEILKDEKMKKAQIFMTTHSNHLLDLSLENKNDTSIFSFQKEKILESEGNTQKATFRIDNLISPDNNLLDLLGVHNSSVFLANCTIWVEGITDRKYIKQFLKIYFTKIENENKKNGINTKKYIEGLHYSFVEYAGANIVHWNFGETNNENQISSKSISNRIFLIADSDIKVIKQTEDIKIDNEQYFEIDKTIKIENNLEGKVFQIDKYKRHQKLNKELNYFYKLESKEIENILTPTVIKGIIKNPKKTDNSTFIKDKKLIYWWQNLGEFIDEKLIEKKVYKKDNTIKDKVNFCTKAINFMEKSEIPMTEKYNDYLSFEAKNLCKRIVEFIEKNN